MSGDRPFDAVALHPDDSVAVALRDLAEGEAVRVGGLSRPTEVTAGEAVPAFFKVALEPIGAGDAVRKHGEVIGAATEPIAAGRVVHVHNLRSLRARAKG